MITEMLVIKMIHTMSIYDLHTTAGVGIWHKAVSMYVQWTDDIETPI